MLYGRRRLIRSRASSASPPERIVVHLVPVFTIIASWEADPSLAASVVRCRRPTLSLKVFRPQALLIVVFFVRER